MTNCGCLGDYTFHFTRTHTHTYTHVWLNRATPTYTVNLMWELESESAIRP